MDIRRLTLTTRIWVLLHSKYSDPFQRRSSMKTMNEVIGKNQEFRNEFMMNHSPDGRVLLLRERKNRVLIFQECVRKLGKRDGTRLASILFTRAKSGESALNLQESKTCEAWLNGRLYCDVQCIMKGGPGRLGAFP